jgi:putative transposase
MSSNFKIYDNNGIYFITSATIEHIPIFTYETMFNILIDSFKFCRKEKGLKIYAYVIMDNHFHAIVSCEKLIETIRDLKRFTAKKIIESIKVMKYPWLLNQIEFWKKGKKINSNFQVWQEGFHPQQIISDEMLIQKIEYIHNNPVKRGFVEKPEDWKYSSARNFFGDNSIIELDILF